VNFYQRHIGDYLKATSHLSLLEHGIYTRLLDVYYTREGAIPAEQSARLVGARSKEEKAALDSVLAEFFTSTPEGWRQKRCDEEIAMYTASEGEREQKQAHETERMRRYRERRKEMFATLRERGIIPKWDIAMDELQRIFNASETDLQREQVDNRTCSVTATHTHTQYKKNAEPDGSHENAAPQKPADVIWTVGVSLLKDKGASEDAARAFLGKHAKGAESQLAEVIGYLATNPKIDPKAYIVKAMQPKARTVVL